MVKNLYAILIKIDETLPWIELKGEYQTRREAKREAEKILNSIKIKFVKVSEKREPVKALATAKTVR